MFNSSLIGGGKCSLCRSDGTNMSTCPLNPNCPRPNHARHPNATGIQQPANVPVPRPQPPQQPANVPVPRPQPRPQSPQQPANVPVPRPQLPQHHENVPVPRPQLPPQPRHQSPPQPRHQPRPVNFPVPRPPAPRPQSPPKPHSPELAVKASPSALAKLNLKTSPKTSPKSTIPITKKQCQSWIDNAGTDPITGRFIKPSGSRFSTLINACKKHGIIIPIPKQSFMELHKSYNDEDVITMTPFDECEDDEYQYIVKLGSGNCYLLDSIYDLYSKNNLLQKKTTTDPLNPSYRLSDSDIKKIIEYKKIINPSFVETVDVRHVNQLNLSQFGGIYCIDCRGHDSIYFPSDVTVQMTRDTSYSSDVLLTLIYQCNERGLLYNPVTRKSDSILDITIDNILSLVLGAIGRNNNELVRFIRTAIDTLNDRLR